MLARTVHINLTASLCPPSSTIINNRTDKARQVESVTFRVRVDLTLALTSRYINTSGNPAQQLAHLSIKNQTKIPNKSRRDGAQKSGSQKSKPQYH